jgi:hypothetical protein
LDKYVQNLGVKRNPVFGFPHIQYDLEDQRAGESPEMREERKRMFNLCLIGDTSNSKKKSSTKNLIESKEESEDEE